MLSIFFQVSSEEFFEAATGWINYDLDNRKKILKEFIKLFDFENMAPGFIKETVLDEVH